MKKNKNNESIKNNPFKNTPTHSLNVKNTNVVNADITIRNFTDDLDLNSFLSDIRNLPNNIDVNLHILSPGGLVNQLFAIKNVLINEKNFNITTYLHYGYSCGAMIFLLGKERIIFEDSAYMLHSMGWGQIDTTNHATDYKNMTDIHEKHLYKMLSKYLKENEIEDLKNGKEYWFGVDELFKYKIATHILINGNKMNYKEYKKYLKDNKDV